MSRAVWKFPLEVIDEQSITMPEDAELLSVQVQQGVVCLWAWVDDAHKMVERQIYIRGTGHEANIDALYVATFMAYGGDLVFHVFDGGEK